MANNTQKPDRIFWLDCVKAVAIFFVILIHSASTPQMPPINQLDWIVLVFYDSISRICVPLFVMVSGALLLGKIEPYTTFFKKRIHRILIPWIVWTAIYLSVLMVTKEIRIASGSDFMNQLYEISFNYFWFMPMIAGLYFLTPILRIWIQNVTQKNIAYILLLWLSMYSLFPFFMKLVSPNYTIPNPFILEHLGYFILGYVFFKSSKPTLKAQQLILIFAGCFMANSTGTFLAYELNRPDLQTYFWSNLSFFVIIASTCAFVLIKNIFGHFKPSSNKKPALIIVTISNVSLGMYLIHGLILNILPFPQFTMYMPYGLKILIVTVIVFVLSLSTILILQKTPFKRFFA